MSSANLRSTIKAQTLADFVAEFTPINAPASNSNPPAHMLQSDNFLCWTLFVDGSSNQAGSGAGLLLLSPPPERVQINYALRLMFSASNNEAEYEALIAGLKLAKALGVRHINIYSDSQLVVCQVTSQYQAKEERMISYL